jgi:hypothetical protein
VRDGRRQILRVLVEPAQEDEDVVGPGTVNEVALRHLAFVTGWEDQELAALTGIRPEEPDVTKELATIDRDGALPVI